MNGKPISIYKFALGLFAFGAFILLLQYARFIDPDVHYEGRIINKYIDSPNHMAERITLKTTKGLDEPTFYPAHIYDVMDTGDYVIKRDGSPDYMLIKKNQEDTLVFKGY